MKKVARILILFGVLCLLWLPAGTAVSQDGQEGAPQAVVITLQGPLTPVWIEHLDRALDTASEHGAQVVVIQLDTPGGDIDQMNRIVQQIRNNPIPVVVYVSPRNAMAASAGTIITLAGHVSAMAPETTIGAASPVGSQGEDIGQTMESKVKEVLKASVRSLTTGRPEEARRLAEETIESARAVTAEEAIEIGLVDLQASDLDDLLTKLDGREVQMPEGVITLHTRGAVIIEVENTLIEQVLGMLVNPNLVFLLLSIGVQAILIEISSPGGWVAGFIGVSCLLLAVYGLGILPVNWFGLLFLVVAFVLFILDIKAPTHGALTISGAVSFIAGALILFNSNRIPGFPAVSVPLVVGTGVFIAASFLLLLSFALRALKAPVLVGRESMLQQVGVAKTAIDPYGSAQVAGELWGAELEEGGTAIPQGSRVEVVRVEGVRLIVRQKD
ncbi:MAG: nodulation protein NfeD [Anaerolineae bacterium]|nr:nodulation protein NfeD [Anaerolineae bacterium]